MEYKVINKNLMVTRANKNCSWRAESNIFELVKAFLLWNYSSDMLPLFPPYIDELAFPDLHSWYMHLGKPNPPQTRSYVVSHEHYIEWLRGLDLSKPFDKAACDAHFCDAARGTKPKEVDEIAIAEAEND